MDNGYILSIDQGTTGSTALIVKADTLEVVAKSNLEYPQHYPHPGWVEHDLDDIWNSIKESVLKSLKIAKISANQIQAIGITNQRETVCPLNKKGQALAKAIVWQDRRTEKFCNENRSNFIKLQNICGLPLDPYFSGTKMKWLLENNSKIKEAYNNDDLLLCNIDSFILYRLSDGNSYYTDATNASRTLLMDLKTCAWSDELCTFLEISPSILPEIKSSFYDFGQTSNCSFLPDGIPILCMMGDQQAALFGQTCFEEGQIKCTYGTGAFILQNTGTNIIHSKNGLLTTVAYKDADKTYYALEGSCYIAGAAVQWMRDELKSIKNASEIEELAKSVNLKDCQELYFLPFFTGLGSPYWKSHARGAILGLSRGSGHGEIARACLEGICLSVHDLISAINNESNKQLESINVDGGACANDLLMEIQANFSGCEILRPQVIETTAFGVALGCYKQLNSIKLNDIKDLWNKDKSFYPETESQDYYQSKISGWREYIKKLFLKD